MKTLIPLFILILIISDTNWNHGLYPEDVRDYFEDYEEEIQSMPPDYEEVELIEFI